VREDPLVDRVVDLDEVAAVLVERAVRWRSAGLAIEAMTWRDGQAEWPQPLETDRARVNDPDSLGLVVAGSAGAELSVVVFRGGWADVDFFDGLDDAGSLPAADIESAADFAARMDQWIVRVFGNSGSVR